jgi:hypothetical protein
MPFKLNSANHNSRRPTDENDQNYLGSRAGYIIHVMCVSKILDIPQAISKRFSQIPASHVLTYYAYRCP